tara:strand:- start:8912 stop:11530 length:2619 start_codon:yes stop_codon:yes gene_type:complete
MRSTILQSSFVSGELDPTIYSRLDINQRERGARTLTNFRLLPQGGIAKRGGTEFLVDTGAECWLFEWAYSVTQAYIIMAYPDVGGDLASISIFDTTTETIVATLEGSQFFDAERLNGLRYRQVLDTMFLVHEDVEPQRLVKFDGYGADPFACTNGSPVVTVTRTWHGLNAGDLITFEGVPVFASFPAGMWQETFIVMAAPTDHTFDITVSSNAVAPAADEGGGAVASWVLAVAPIDFMPKVDFNDSLSPEAARNTQVRITFNKDDTWASFYGPGGGWSPTGDTGNPGTLDPFSNYNPPGGSQPLPIFVFKSASTAPHTYSLTIGGQEIKKIAVATTSLGKVSLPETWAYLYSVLARSFPIWRTNPTVLPLAPTDIDGSGTPGLDLAGNWYIVLEFLGPVFGGQEVSLPLFSVSGPGSRPSIIIEPETAAGDKFEDVWSAGRGWPRSVEYFEGRLCYGGSKYFPSTFWASHTGDYRNFALGDAHDDEAISRDVDVNAADGIEHMVGTRALMVLTRRAEYYQTETPFTPESATFKRQTSHGSSYVAPVEVGGSVYFVQRNGRAVRRLLYNFQEDSFVAEEVSILARHMLNSPVDMAAYAHPQDGDYIIIVNADGTAAVLTVDRNQDVAGWTRYSLGRGAIVSVVAVNDVVYFLNAWTDAGVTRYQLDKLRDDRYFDSSMIQYDSITTFSGIEQLCRANGSERNDVGVRIDFTDGGAPFVDTNANVVANVYTYTAVGDYVGREIYSIEMGYGLSAVFVPLPADIRTQGGDMLLRRKRTSRVTLDCLDTDAGAGNTGPLLLVNGEGVKQHDVFAEKGPNASAWVVDGQVSVALLGWGRGQANQDTIVLHSGAGRCTIRSIEREVEVTGHLGEEGRD